MCVQVRPVRRRVVVQHLQRAIQLEERIPRIVSAAVEVKISITRDHVEVSIIVRSRAASAHPERRLAMRRCGTKRRHLVQRTAVRVIAEEPALPGRVVAVRTERDICHAIQEQQCRPLQLARRIEGRISKRARDLHRPAKLLRPGDQVKRVQPVNLRAILHRQCQHVEVFVAASIAGVPVIPTSGEISPLAG